MKKSLIIFLKFVVSIGLLAYIFHHSKITLTDVSQIIHESNPWIFLLCIIIYCLGQVLSTYKWSLLIHSHGVKHPFPNLVSYYFVGMFFNLFMPSIVGGDIQRCYAVYRDEKVQSRNQLQKGRLSQVISSVMMERATGVVAMIWLANISYFFFFKNMKLGVNHQDKILNVYLPWFLALLLIGTMIGFIILMVLRINKSESVSNKSWIAKSIQSVKHIASQLQGYIHTRGLMIRVMVLSLIFQSMMVFINILMGIALGLNISLSYYFIIVPLITIWIALLPISLNGLGVRETAYVYLLQFANIDGTHAILLSFSIFIIMAINALIGGIILLKRGFFIEKDIIQEE